MRTPRVVSPTLSQRAVYIAASVTAAAVLAILPISRTRLSAQSSFPTMVVCLVACFDLLCAGLLLQQFRDCGERRLLALSSAYAFSLMIVVGYALTFPGIINTRPPSWATTSTAPWLWVIWHTEFPVLLGLSLGPWRHSWTAPTRPERRVRSAVRSLLACTSSGVVIVIGVVVAERHLPVLIHGLDTSAMTRIAGPVMLPLVAVGVALTLFGVRRSGPERWAAVAAAAAMGDVVLTLFSMYRYSLGWYVGRSLTVVSSAVVLVAIFAELGAVRRELAREGERLRVQLARTDDLERLQNTLLSHMSDAVVMQDRQAEVVAHNSAARQWFGLDEGQFCGPSGLVRLRKELVAADGSPWGNQLTPVQYTLRTGESRRNEIVGVRRRNGECRWLSVSTAAAIGVDGSVDYVVSSMTDISSEYCARLAAAEAAVQRQGRVKDMLEGNALAMVFQPIVALESGRIAGYEALARFPGDPPRAPNRWFADAAAEGLGTELELKAIELALAQLPTLPDNAYLSLNASPSTATSSELFELLDNADSRRLVLELTEHADVEDYESLCAAMARLRTLGVRVAVDDAGAGFASLRHILNLQPDVIKLDIALTRGIDNDAARRALATALLQFGVEISATIVAEGIETDQELETLRSLGIGFGQGYLLGRPTSMQNPEQSAVVTQIATDEVARLGRWARRAVDPECVDQAGQLEEPAH